MVLDHPPSRARLQVRRSTARDLGLHDLAIAALAKERESLTGDKVVDRVYLPGQKNGIAIGATSALVLLARSCATRPTASRTPGG